MHPRAASKTDATHLGAPTRPDRARSKPPTAPPRARAPPPSLPTPTPRPPAIASTPATASAVPAAPAPVWSDCFDHRKELPVPVRNTTFRIYYTPLTDAPLLVFLHGGGHSALSWALVARNLRKRVAVLAYDARAHGATLSHDGSEQLSVDNLIDDGEALVEEFLASVWCGPLPRIVLVGHSMGGAIATRLAPAVGAAGLVVVDVVEGTAIPALPHMSDWVRARPVEFESVDKAIAYVIRAGHVRNEASASLSVPSQLTSKDGKYVWRTDLEASEPFWHSWFIGLSNLFVSVPAAKMLVLAGVDRLDKQLMIAQMQGKFQNILIPSAGHAVHEDQPESFARVLLEYLERNLFISSEEEAAETAVYQQRSPIPPCC